MSSYQTKCESIVIGDSSFEITSLKDKCQFHDPDNTAEKLGISDNMWPISGLIWPSALVLAKLVQALELKGLRILEVGCGIGIASIVAASKKADITASDFHPITETLLNNNVEANKLKPIKYITGDWNYPVSTNGKFDLIIGSDLLYEREHVELLSRYIDCHMNERGKFLLIDPGRRTARKIKRAMEKLGFSNQTTRLSHEAVWKKNGYFTQYLFSREATV
ncbi:Predicted methyltransferase [Alteromonadaceae bacterium Bs31]|nr:Predicted methyltransferase [Alteromonadaceae bacterium Bs31]